MDINVLPSINKMPIFYFTNNAKHLFCELAGIPSGVRNADEH